jgi:hypothetical protein
MLTLNSSNQLVGYPLNLVDGKRAVAISFLHENTTFSNQQITISMAPFIQIYRPLI